MNHGYKFNKNDLEKLDIIQSDELNEKEFSIELDDSKSRQKDKSANNFQKNVIVCSSHELEKSENTIMNLNNNDWPDLKNSVRLTKKNMNAYKNMNENERMKNSKSKYTWTSKKQLKYHYLKKKRDSKHYQSSVPFYQGNSKEDNQDIKIHRSFRY